MAIKKKDGTPIKGIIARPGAYKYSWGIEYKTAAELKRAIAMTPTIPITLGHPEGGVIKRSDFIGRMKPTWHDEEDGVEGEFWPYVEHWHKVPEDIREKIVNGEAWKISARFNAEKVDEDIQKDVYIDHVAILREGDNPICPLDKCGINVRQESQETPQTKIYLEQSNEIGGDGLSDKEPTKKSEEPVVSEQKPEPSEMELMKTEMTEMRSIIADLKKEKEELSEPKPEVVQEETEIAPVVEPVTQSIEPEVDIPVGAVPKEDKLTFNERGHLEITYQPKKSK